MTRPDPYTLIRRLCVVLADDASGARMATGGMFRLIANECLAACEAPAPVEPAAEHREACIESAMHVADECRRNCIGGPEPVPPPPDDAANGGVVNPSWCPQCGPDVSIDEDGCCQTCGCDAIGPGADEAHAMRAKLAAAEQAREELLDRVNTAEQRAEGFAAANAAAESRRKEAARLLNAAEQERDKLREAVGYTMRVVGDNEHDDVCTCRDCELERLLRAALDEASR